MYQSISPKVPTTMTRLPTARRAILQDSEQNRGPLVDSDDSMVKSALLTQNGCVLPAAGIQGIPYRQGALKIEFWPEG